MTDHDGIVLEDIRARKNRSTIGPLTLSFSPGTSALLGTPGDGTRLVLDVIAGRLRPRSGRVRVFGAAPRDALQTIAWVPLDVALPGNLRVDEAMHVAAELRARSAAEPVERLALFGLRALAPRLVSSLSRQEARAVAFAEAVTSGARAVLIDEPFADIDGRAAAHVRRGLELAAQGGACVVFATASLSRACALADRVHVLSRGVLARSAAAQQTARVVAVTRDGGALASGLALEAPELTIEVQHGRVVAVTGKDAQSMMRAVGRAVVKANVALDSLDIRAAVR